MKPTLLLPLQREQQGMNWTSDEADPAHALPKGVAKESWASDDADPAPTLPQREQARSWASDEADPAPALPKEAARQELDQRRSRSCSCLAKSGSRRRAGPTMKPTLPVPCHKEQQSKSWTSDEADPALALPKGEAGHELDQR